MAHESNKIYMGDVGITILVNCGIDLTGAVNIKIKMQKPDKTEYSFNATIQDLKFLKYITAQKIPGFHHAMNMSLPALTTDSGILTNSTYNIVINEQVIILDTNGLPFMVTYQDLIDFLNTNLSVYGVNVSVINNDLIFKNNDESEIIIEHAIMFDLLNSINDFIEFKEPSEGFEGDFDQYGKYCIQSYAELGSWKGHGEAIVFDVYKRFN